MQIELTGQARETVEKLIAQGQFQSAEEAVEHALNFYETCQPTIESLRAKIQEGMDDIAAGRVTSYESDEELQDFIEDVKRRGRERLAAKQHR